MEITVIVLTIIVCGLMIAVKILQDNMNSKVEKLKIELQVLEGIQSKMSDELFKMNGLDKRISVLEHIPPTIYGLAFCDGTHCTNPFHDCINCPRQFGSGGTITTTGAIKKD